MRLFSICLCLFSFLLGSARVLAQDERFVRSIFSGELLGPSASENFGDVSNKYKWEAQTSIYLYDIDNNGLMEGVQYAKRDGEDWFLLFDNNGRKVFEKKLETLGIGSSLYKIHLKTLSKDSILMVLYFYEGQTKYLQFNGSAVAYFLTMDKQDFRTLSLFKGPSFFDEKERPLKHYHQREYDLNVVDLDNDGVKEVVLKYRGIISRTYVYQGQGKWISNNQH